MVNAICEKSEKNLCGERPVRHLYGGKNESILNKSEIKQDYFDKKTSSIDIGMRFFRSRSKQLPNVMYSVAAVKYVRPQINILVKMLKLNKEIIY
jgi:hypothetical protein